MKKLISAMVFAMFLGFSADAFACASHSAIKVSEAWTWPTARGSSSGALFLVIENTGEKEDRLMSVKADISGKARIHDTAVVEGVSQMREMKDGLVVPAHQSVAFSSEGTHIMLTGLKKPLVRGEKISVVLQFKKAGAINVIATVMPRGYLRNDRNEAAQDHTAH